MKTVIYHRSTCSTCRQAQEFLAQKGAKFGERDFFKYPFTGAELRSLLKSLKLTPHDVISTKSPSYKKLGLDKRVASDDELVKMMVHEPRLLRRPLIVIDGRAIIGFDKAQLMEELKK